MKTKVLLLLMAACLVAVPFSHGQGEVVTAVGNISGPITTIRSCVPFNVLIKVNSSSSGNTTISGGLGASNGNATNTSNTNIEVTAEQNVVNATGFTFDNSTLEINMKQSFNTKKNILVTITLDSADSLTTIENSGTGDLIISGDVDSDNLELKVANMGGIFLEGANSITQLNITATGTSVIVANGTFQNVNISADGTAKVFVVGPSAGLVTAKVGGISTTTIESATSITGVADGLAKIIYVQGTCDMKPRYDFGGIFGINIFGSSVCTQVAGPVNPNKQHTWTCGIIADGQTSCRALSLEFAPVFMPVVSGVPPTTNMQLPLVTVSVGSAGSSSTGSQAPSPAPQAAGPQQASASAVSSQQTSGPVTSVGVTVVSQLCEDTPTSMLASTP